LSVKVLKGVIHIIQHFVYVFLILTNIRKKSNLNCIYNDIYIVDIDYSADC